VPAGAGATSVKRETPTKEQAKAAEDRMRMDHLLYDVAPIVHAIATEQALQKKYKPSEILSNQIALVMGGIAKILLGGIQAGTAGVFAPITGPMIAGVDLATAGARAGLNAGDTPAGTRPPSAATGVRTSVAEAGAESAAKSLLVVAGTRVVSPMVDQIAVPAGSVMSGLTPLGDGATVMASSFIPVGGGLLAMGMGLADIAAGLKGLVITSHDREFILASRPAITALLALVKQKAAEIEAAGFKEISSDPWRRWETELEIAHKTLSALLAQYPKSTSTFVDLGEAPGAGAGSVTRGRAPHWATLPPAAAAAP
jgi:hypothetical protein